MIGVRYPSPMIQKLPVSKPPNPGLSAAKPKAAVYEFTT
jgi:hypothetical protein